MAGPFARPVRAVQAIACLAVACLTIACLASPALGQTEPSAEASARPLAVEDIVGLESFGRAEIAPNGAWAVYERRGAYDTAPRFDYGPRSQWAIMDLWLADLANPERPAERLLPAEPPGLLKAVWSPSGARLLIYRFRDGKLEAGVVTMSDRSVRWTGLTPEMPLMGAAFEWITDDRVLLVVRPDRSLPWLLRYYQEGQRVTTQAWRRTAEGRQASRTAIETDDGVAVAETTSAQQALVVVDATSGSVRPLLQARIVDFALSPDGSTVAVTQEGEALGLRPDVINQGEAPTRQHLSLIDIASGAAAPTRPPLEVAPHLLRWSPDSSALLVWARSGEVEWGDGDLHRVERDGRFSVIDSGALDPMPPPYGVNVLIGVRAEWMGDKPVLYARAPGQGRFDWHALSPDHEPVALTASMTNPPGRIAAVSPDSLLVFADGAAWSLDAQGSHKLSPDDLILEETVIGDPEKPFRLRMNDAPRRSWAPALGEGGETLAASLDGSLRRIGPALASGEIRVLASEPGAALVLDRSGLVETLHLRTADAGRPIDEVNGHLEGVSLPGAIPLDYTDAVGRDVRSWIFLPPDMRPDAIKGVIVQVYPGSVDRGAWSGPMSLTYGVRAQVLAGAGYAVISPSIPVSGPLSGERVERSVDAAVDAALAAWPSLPGDRLAILGHSFGMTAALLIATRSDRYRSYVLRAGTSDMFSKWGEFAPAARTSPQEGFMFRNQQGWTEVGQGALGGPPWANVEAYAAASPYLASDRIRSPMLLIGADRDFVALSQTEQMFSALHRLGGHARLLTYWGEEHMLWSPANIRDQYREILIWLDRTLGPAGTLAARPTRSPENTGQPAS